MSLETAGPIQTGREHAQSLGTCRRWLRGRRAAIPDTLSVLMITLWPFVFLWAYVSESTWVGNDFLHRYNYKVYLVASLAESQFPLWASTEAAGFPLYSNPFAQTFYPLNVLYLLYYLSFGGLTGWDFTLFTILGLSIYGVGLYCWLRQLSIATPVALAAVLIALMSLKLTEILRFPNAIHSAAWMPWLLYGIALATDRARLPVGAAIVGLSSLMLLTAGYPYYIVYSVFLVGPFLLAMLFGATRRVLLGADAVDAAQPICLLLWIGGAFTFAGAIAFPWLNHLRVLMAQTVDRATPNFNYATQHRFSYIDTIGSWIFPPASVMEGWYYFGMIAALLISAYLLTLTVRDAQLSRDRRVALMILPWLALVTYFSWGRDSALFTLVWPHIPVLNQMRVWGRMNIILVPVLTLLLAFALSHFGRVLRMRREGPARQPLFLAGATMLLSFSILVVQFYMLRRRLFSDYWERHFKSGLSYLESGSILHTLAGSFNEKYFLYMTVLAAVAIVTLLLLAHRFRRVARPGFFLTAVLGVSVVDLYFVSNFQWLDARAAQNRERISISTFLHDGFSRPREIGPGSVEPLHRKQTVGPLRNWGFQRHADFYLRYFTLEGAPRPDVAPEQVAAATRFYGADQHGRRLFLTGSIAHSTPADFMADVDATAAVAEPVIDLQHFNGDSLRLTVRLDQPSWLSYVDNWDSNWTATVDGRSVPIELLFGSYKAIRLPAGSSRVTFVYRPRWWPKV